jgi:hypothetical protein
MEVLFGERLLALTLGFLFIGIFLLIFYSARLYYYHRKYSQEHLLKRLENLEGWSGGACFISAGFLFELPYEFKWLCLPIGVIIVISFFPVAYLIQHMAKPKI